MSRIQHAVHDQREDHIDGRGQTIGADGMNDRKRNELQVDAESGTKSGSGVSDRYQLTIVRHFHRTRNRKPSQKDIAQQSDVCHWYDVE